jgi:hypothetical protein
MPGVERRHLRQPRVPQNDRTMRPLQPVRCNINRVRAADAVEAIAVEVFREAESSGQLVTMSMINRAVEQLQGHRPSCRCGLCGEVAAKAKAERVYRTAWASRRSIRHAIAAVYRRRTSPHTVRWECVDMAVTPDHRRTV